MKEIHQKELLKEIEKLFEEIENFEKVVNRLAKRCNDLRLKIDALPEEKLQEN